MDIVILDGYTLNPGDLSWKPLKDLGNLTVYDRTPSELVDERIQTAEIVFTNKTVLTAENLASEQKLRYIGVLATGYNVVDIDAAGRAGIVVTNIPTYGTAAVAQYAAALLLELCHHVGEHGRCVQAGEWSKNPDWCFWKYPLTELAGKTMGIVGFGKIGQSTARIAQALGMKILAFDRYRKPELESDTCRYAGWDELLRESDVISLHCPLFPETKGIINCESLRKMKDGVLIINTARGELIVEKDLRDAVDAGKVGGAAVDVVSKEPIEIDNPLLGCDRIIITPHIAWAPAESRKRLLTAAAENLRSFLDGTPKNVVN